MLWVTLLAHAQPQAEHLTSLHRFQSVWERCGLIPQEVSERASSFFIKHNKVLGWESLLCGAASIGACLWDGAQVGAVTCSWC